MFCVCASGRPLGLLRTWSRALLPRDRLRSAWATWEAVPSGDIAEGWTQSVKKEEAEPEEGWSGWRKWKKSGWQSGKKGVQDEGWTGWQSVKKEEPVQDEGWTGWQSVKKEEPEEGWKQSGWQKWKQPGWQSQSVKEEQDKWTGWHADEDEYDVAGMIAEVDKALGKDAGKGKGGGRVFRRASCVL